MIVGYTRLSKDDDRQNYISIEHQKLIITQAAAENNMVPDRFYEDDGFSGYKFDRPGFQAMLQDLTNGNHTIFVKDLSRLGRNNGKVLSLLDEFKENGIRLIAVDDNYDTENPEDDIIGIRTWYNERYVKDASKKIKRVLSARQKEGTLPVQVPYGYVRSNTDKQQILIIAEEASCVRLIYDLYIKGYGYRKIASYLTENHIPTPSMTRHMRAVRSGKVPKQPVAGQWSDGMVKEILGNDFYIGTYRLHKRERTAIHGNDRRVPQSRQYVWENHHAAVVDCSVFALAQELRRERIRTNYRGSSGIPSPFGSCLFCKECGRRLTPIVRKTQSGSRKYYICSTYNSKGRRYCSKSHLIEEQSLQSDVLTCLQFCRDTLFRDIADYDATRLQNLQLSPLSQRTHWKKLIAQKKASLKVILSQKVQDIAANPVTADAIRESYKELEQDIFTDIAAYERNLQQSEIPLTGQFDIQGAENTLTLLDKILADGKLDRKDIELLIDTITVDEFGEPDITLKYCLPIFSDSAPNIVL